jgi:hypothetical protein
VKAEPPSRGWDLGGGLVVGWVGTPGAESNRGLGLATRMAGNMSHFRRFSARLLSSGASRRAVVSMDQA